MSNLPKRINVPKLRHERVLHGNTENSWASSNRDRKDFKTNIANASNTTRNTTLNTGIQSYSSKKSKWKKLNKALSKTNSVKEGVITYIQDYLKFSTLHGLRYIGDSLISFWERAFWLISFLIAVVFAVFFIRNIYLKYNNEPVITIINPNPYKMEHIPFPAVAVCNMNLVKRTEAEAILANGTTADRSFLEDLCNANSQSGFMPLTAQEDTKNWTYYFNFLSRVSQPCKKMLKLCQWRHEEIDCQLIFKTILTDNRICCSFNQLPINYIIRKPEKILKNNITSSGYHVDDWNPERGYSVNTSFKKVYPFRSIGAGAHLGLTLTLNIDKEDYYCSITNSMGFNLLLHNPLEIPQMNARSLMVLPGYEERIAFTSTVQDVSTTLKSMDVSKRKCYFTSERYLQYYRIYSRVSCKMECLVNYTLERCGCILNFLPTSSPVRICGIQQESCRLNTEAWLDQQEDEETEIKCNCLPTCFQIDYEVSTSRAKIWDQNFINNSAIVHIFYTDDYSQRFTKKELYEFSEFLSLTGGLLGLFLGLSALSIVEMLLLIFKMVLQCISYKK